MKIRKAKAKDARGIVEVHYDSIHNVANAVYDKEILDAWNDGVTEERIEKTRDFIENSKAEVFICEDKREIVGFGTIVPAYNEIRAIYVRASYVGKGVGKEILQNLESRAFELSLYRLNLCSSIIAEKFYQKSGYSLLRRGFLSFSNGKRIECSLMEKHFVSKPKVELVTDKSLQSCIDFLERRKETCLFLLCNLSNYGFKITKHPNSGNYRLLKRDNEVVGVFSMTRRGNILIQTDGKDNYSHEIYQSTHVENINQRSIIGPWEDCSFLKSYCEIVNKTFKIKSVSKEYLYVLKLSDWEEKEEKNASSKKSLVATLLTKKDFNQWSILNHAYLVEMGLPETSFSEIERQAMFEEQVRDKRWWGVLQENRLVSIGTLNTRYKNMGQIGGVFTVLEKRGEGYSKLCMERLIADSKKVHQLDILILFTNENNMAAQSIYERLGFKRVGYFGLVFNQLSDGCEK